MKYSFPATTNPDERGFSLIETLVTVMIFSVIMVTVGSLFGKLSGLQGRGIGAQKVQENALFVLESIAREVRVSSIPAGQNGDCSTVFPTTLSVVHPVADTITYALVNGVVQRTAGGVTTNMSSQDVTFTRFYFCASGTGQDTNQARITIIATVVNNTSSADSRMQFDLQTTIASRDIASEL